MDVGLIIQRLLDQNLRAINVNAYYGKTRVLFGEVNEIRIARIIRVMGPSQSQSGLGSFVSDVMNCIAPSGSVRWSFLCLVLNHQRLTSWHNSDIG